MTANLAVLADSLWLLPIAFVTSTLAGVVGLGGGVLLIMLMPGFVPSAAIMPVHAAVQLASNGSRAAFAWRHIDLGMIPCLLLGGVAGAALGGQVYRLIDLQWLPLVIGFLILVITWFPLRAPGGDSDWALVLLGAYQTGLGMIAGATGPLGAAVLLRRHQGREWLVVNTAVYMAIAHLLRVLAFTVLGFTFAPYIILLLALFAAVTAGSWFGTRVRSVTPEVNFVLWFRLLVTLLALRMIALSFLDASA